MAPKQAQKQPQDPNAQQAKKLASTVQRVRGWVGSDPSRNAELADALVELTSHRLLGHSYPDAASDAQESVVLAGKLLTANGPIGPYTPVADAVRYFTAAVHLAVLQLGVGVVDGAARTMRSTLDWQEQLRKHLDIAGQLAPSTAVWALSVQARSALVDGKVDDANACADAALDRLVEAGLTGAEDYLPMDVHRLVADCRWAAGEPTMALSHDELAREAFERVVDGRLANPGRLSPALLARLSEPLFPLNRVVADRLVAGGEADRGLVVRRALIASLQNLTKRLGDPATAQLALSLDDLAADLRLAGRSDEAALADEEARAEAERVTDQSPLAGLGASAAQVDRRRRTEPPIAWAPLDDVRSLAASTAGGAGGSAQDAEAEMVRQADERAAAERAEAKRLEEARQALARAELVRREEERAEAEHLAARRAAQARLEAERAEAERAEADRLEAERRAAEEEAERLETKRRREERIEAHRLEEERLEAERLAAERLAAARLAAERQTAGQPVDEELQPEELVVEDLQPEELDPEEVERLELERLAADLAELERVEADRVAAEQVEADRVAAEQAEADRVAAERVEADRVAAERVEADRVAAERVEADRVAAEQAEADRLKAEQAEADRVAAEQVEADRVAAEEAEAARLDAERLEAERAEADRVAAEQAEADRVAAERAEADRVAAEQAEADRVAAEQAEADRVAAEQAEADRVAAEQAEADRVAEERAEAERLEAERLLADRVAAEQVEADLVEAERAEAERVETERERPAGDQSAQESPTAESSASESSDAPEPTATEGQPDDLDLAIDEWQAAKVAGERRRARAANERVVELLRPKAQADLRTYGPQLIDALEQLSSIRLRTGDIFGSRAPSKEAKAIAKSLGL